MVTDETDAAKNLLTISNLYPESLYTLYAYMEDQFGNVTTNVTVLRFST